MVGLKAEMTVDKMVAMKDGRMVVWGEAERVELMAYEKVDETDVERAAKTVHLKVAWKESVSVDWKDDYLVESTVE